MEAAAARLRAGEKLRLTELHPGVKLYAAWKLGWPPQFVSTAELLPEVGLALEYCLLTDQSENATGQPAADLQAVANAANAQLWRKIAPEMACPL